MSFVLRYVDRCGEIQERLLGMEHVSSTTAEALFDLVKMVLSRFGLELRNLRGQFYDGASNMSGQNTRGKPKCPLCTLSCSLIESCASKHHLSKLSESKFFWVIQSLYNFIAGSSKRHDVFLKMQNERGMSTPVTLKSLNDTRWASHINSLHSLNTALSAILDTLEAVAENESDSRIVAEANGLVNSVSNFEFLLIFIVMLEILGTINALSQLLQQKKQDFLNATKLVKATTLTLQHYRSDDSWDQE